MNERFETDLLAQLIDRKHAVLVQLRELARRQLELIADGDMNKLLHLLAVKQKLLGQLQEVERELDPFRQQDPEQRLWRSQAERLRCRSVAQRCEALLQEIMVVEKRSEADLIHRRDQAAAQLQGIHRAGEARSAYRPAGPAGPSHIDLTSQS